MELLVVDPDGRADLLASRGPAAARSQSPRWCGLVHLAEKWHGGLPEYDVDSMLALARGLDDVEDVKDLTDAFTET